MMEDFKRWVAMEEISWRQESREIWLKERNKNTIFFFFIKWPMLEEEEIFWLRVDSELPIDEYNIKVGIANAFRMILVESRDWRSSISGLNFDPLPHMNQKHRRSPSLRRRA